MSRRVAIGLSLLAAVFCVAHLGTAAAGEAARTPAPATSGQTVTGGKASLAALRGKPVFINVWSSW